MGDGSTSSSVARSSGQSPYFTKLSTQVGRRWISIKPDPKAQQRFHVDSYKSNIGAPLKLETKLRLQDVEPSRKTQKSRAAAHIKAILTRREGQNGGQIWHIKRGKFEYNPNELRQSKLSPEQAKFELEQENDTQVKQLIKSFAEAEGYSAKVELDQAGHTKVVFTPKASTTSSEVEPVLKPAPQLTLKNADQTEDSPRGVAEFPAPIDLDDVDSLAVSENGGFDPRSTVSALKQEINEGGNDLPFDSFEELEAYADSVEITEKEQAALGQELSKYFDENSLPGSSTLSIEDQELIANAGRLAEAARIAEGQLASDVEEPDVVPEEDTVDRGQESIGAATKSASSQKQLESAPELTKLDEAFEEEKQSFSDHREEPFDVHDRRDEPVKKKKRRFFQRTNTSSPKKTRVRKFFERLFKPTEKTTKKPSYQKLGDSFRPPIQETSERFSVAEERLPVVEEGNNAETLTDFDGTSTLASTKSAGSNRSSDAPVIEIPQGKNLAGVLKEARLNPTEEVSEANQSRISRPRSLQRSKVGVGSLDLKSIPKEVKERLKDEKRSVSSRSSSQTGPKELPVRQQTLTSQKSERSIDFGVAALKSERKKPVEQPLIPLNPRNAPIRQEQQEQKAVFFDDDEDSSSTSTGGFKEDYSFGEEGSQGSKSSQGFEWSKPSKNYRGFARYDERSASTKSEETPIRPPSLKSFASTGSSGESSRRVSYPVSENPFVVSGDEGSEDSSTIEWGDKYSVSTTSTPTQRAPEEVSVEDDESLARRLQAEELGGGEEVLDRWIQENHDIGEARPDFSSFDVAARKFEEAQINLAVELSKRDDGGYVEYVQYDRRLENLENQFFTAYGEFQDASLDLLETNGRQVSLSSSQGKSILNVRSYYGNINIQSRDIIFLDQERYGRLQQETDTEFLTKVDQWHLDQL